MNEQRDGNIALKCTYHDGGPAGFIGYEGTCTEANMKRNILTKKVTWCSQEHNECRKYLDRGCRGKRPEAPCYESTLLTEWRFRSGVYHNGPKEGESIPLVSARDGKVALMTTRLPGHDSEAQRVIFAVAKIHKIIKSKDSGVGVVFDPTLRLRIPEEVVQQISYWRFKRGEKRWNTGLVRYWDDAEVAAYLRALYPRLRSPGERQVVAGLLDCVGGKVPDPDENSLLKELNAVPLGLKYGPGGEGEQHRRLKQHIKKHPEILGLGEVRAVHVEYSFPTGDRVDIAVELADGRHAVVEVEVEGESSTKIGAHQAMKYRALMAAKLDVNASPIAVLAAYDIPATTQEFCKRHGVRPMVFKL